MKNLLILILIIGGGYFAYNAFDNSQTVNQPASNQQQQALEGIEDLEEYEQSNYQDVLVTINNQVKDAIADARNAVGDASVTANDFIEAGIADLAGDAVNDTEVQGEKIAAVGVYAKYNNTDLSSIDGKIILDFYASWCPSCRKLESDINDSLLDIPAGVTILQVNYDTETELKQKYGVTRQHTLVQVDQSGDMIHKWSGGSTLESVIEELK